MFDFVNTQSPGNPITEEIISETEHEYGIQFPPLLREYYLAHNGQQMKPVALLIGGEIREVRKITAFRDPRLSLEQMLHMQRQQNFPVWQMIPVADDRGNGIYYLHTGTGAVCYSELRGDDDFQPVCQGIDTFFHILDSASQEGAGSPYDVSKDNAAGTADPRPYLPLGSIVLLRGASKRIMITSRMVHIPQGEEVYRFDYGGVLYPDGFSSDGLIYFNREGIEKIIFRGCADSEDDALQIALKRYTAAHLNENIGSPDLIKE